MLLLTVEFSVNSTADFVELIPELFSPAQFLSFEVNSIPPLGGHYFPLPDSWNILDKINDVIFKDASIFIYGPIYFWENLQ